MILSGSGMDKKEFYFQTDNLVIWRPEGEITLKKIKDFVYFLDSQNEVRDPHFHRFIDLRGLKSIAVQFEDLSGIADLRKSFANSILKKKVKMGFLVADTLSYGMARMYENLLDNESYDIRISYSLDEICDFLEIDPDLSL